MSKLKGCLFLCCALHAWSCFCSTNGVKKRPQLQVIQLIVRDRSWGVDDQSQLRNLSFETCVLSPDDWQEGLSTKSRKPWVEGPHGEKYLEGPSGEKEYLTEVKGPSGEKFLTDHNGFMFLLDDESLDNLGAEGLRGKDIICGSGPSGEIDLQSLWPVGCEEKFRDGLPRILEIFENMIKMTRDRRGHCLTDLAQLEYKILNNWDYWTREGRGAFQSYILTEVRSITVPYENGRFLSFAHGLTEQQAKFVTDWYVEMNWPS